VQLPEGGVSRPVDVAVAIGEKVWIFLKNYFKTSLRKLINLS